MQFVPKSEKKGDCKYPLALQFYREPPDNKISLDEFEKLALERLQVLRIVEHVGTKHNRNSTEYREMLISELKNKKLSSYYKISIEKMNEEIYKERERDHISHFILRLAYCKNETLRRWFLAQEVDLFRMRFISERSTERKHFMELNHIDYKQVGDDEKKMLLPKLAASSNTSFKISGSDIYKIPFIEVLDLVSSRRVFLKHGMAYVSENDFVSIVVSAFRSHLSQSLAIACRSLSNVEEDVRLKGILKNINQLYLGTDFSKSKMQFTGEASPEMIDELAKTSFPLCMRSLHEKLRANHHLKYLGRIQYGLFLKGIGLSMEDSLRFWREELTKVMDIDKFDKGYAYSIRFNYGKEGKRANYTPYSCMKVITTSAPGPGEFHGCPFKQWDANNLQRKLAELKISNSAISEIVDLSSKNHYQLACTKYFEAMHNEASVDQAIQHPNQYFIDSQKVRKGETSKSTKNISHVTTSKAVIYPTSKPNVSIDDIPMDDFEMDIEDLMKGI